MDGDMIDSIPQTRRSRARFKYKGETIRSERHQKYFGLSVIFLKEGVKIRRCFWPGFGYRLSHFPPGDPATPHPRYQAFPHGLPASSVRNITTKRSRSSTECSSASRITRIVPPGSACRALSKHHYRYLYLSTSPHICTSSHRYPDSGAVPAKEL